MGGKERNDENSGHYIIASSQPAQMPIAGTPHGRANYSQLSTILVALFVIG